MYGNGYSYMPAVLVEVAFITNPVAEQILKSDEFLEKAAVGIEKGIEYLAKNNLMSDPVGWIEKIDEPMPVWSVITLLMNIHKDLK